MNDGRREGGGGGLNKVEWGWGRESREWGWGEGGEREVTERRSGVGRY